MTISNQQSQVTFPPLTGKDDPRWLATLLLSEQKPGKLIIEPNQLELIYEYRVWRYFDLGIVISPQVILCYTLNILSDSTLEQNAKHVDQMLSDWQNKQDGRAKLCNSLCDSVLASDVFKRIFCAANYYYDSILEPLIPDPLQFSSSGKLFTKRLLECYQADSYMGIVTIEFEGLQIPWTLINPSLI